MSAFVVPRTHYKLSFADEEYTGLEVTVRAMSVGTALEGGIDLSWVGDKDAPLDEKADRLRYLHERFVEHLIDWNLTEEDGTPVVQTVEGLRSLEPKFCGLLLNSWIYTPTAVPTPLDDGSTSSPASPGVSMEMVDLPDDLAS